MYKNYICPVKIWLHLRLHCQSKEFCSSPGCLNPTIFPECLAALSLEDQLYFLQYPNLKFKCEQDYTAISKKIQVNNNNVPFCSKRSRNSSGRLITFGVKISNAPALALLATGDNGDEL